MIAALGAVGLGLLALPGLLRPVGRRLRPGRWTALCAVALLAGMTFVIGAGVLAALPTALRFADLRKAAKACEVMFGHPFPSGSPQGVAVLGVTLSILALGGRAPRRFHRTIKRSWVESGIGRRIDRGGPYEVVVLEDLRLHALSVPGRSRRSGQVLLTAGLVNTLGPAELDLVCAHEEAHLRLAHHRYLALAMVAEAALWWWSPSRSSARALRLAVERWADEVAAGTTEAARESLASALLAVGAEPERPLLAAFSALEGLIERVDAMRAPIGVGMAAWWWPVLWLPGLALGSVALYTLARFGHGAYCLVTMAGGCHLG